MAVRSTMASLIASVRVLINDPSGANQIFDDQTIQDVMDESRRDLVNYPLRYEPTYSGSSLQFLDYYAGSRESALGGWEDGYVLKQFLTIIMTPTVSEPIAGHFGFATNVLPPVFITGHLFDRYRAAADLLERWAARWMLSYDFASDGQSFKRSQAADALQKLACTYRLKQRIGSIAATRSDLVPAGQANEVSLGPKDIDYMASG